MRTLIPSFLAVLFVATAALAATPKPPMDVPDPAMTPGATNPAVTQITIGTTICVPGWSAAQRASSYYYRKLKVQQIAALGYADQNTSDYEEDHFIPIEDGGSPTDPRNLSPEPYAGPWGARVKDRLENTLHRMICAGQITLKAAQDAITHNWEAAYWRYVVN